MKTMLITVLATLAFVGQVNAAGKFATREAIDGALKKDSKVTTDSVMSLRKQINEYMEKVDSKDEASKAALKAALSKLVNENGELVTALSNRYKVGTTEIKAFVQAAPEILLIEGYMRLDAKMRDPKVESEIATIITKVAPVITKLTDKTSLYAVYKALALVTSDIGGSYEKFRSALAENLAANKNVETALVEAAKAVLGKDATQDQIKAFLAELAKCKV